MNAAKVHVSLNVKDISRSIEWYRLFFGEPPHKVREGYANFDIESPALKLALNEMAPSGSGSLNHLGLLVDSAEQVSAAKKRLETAGLSVTFEEDTSCCHALQTKVWTTDPDGNSWEVYAILDDEISAEAKNETCCADSACC